MESPFASRDEFVVVDYKAASPKIKAPVRAVYFSDLHNAEYGEGNRVLLEEIRREKPDLILVGGDVLVGRSDAGIQQALTVMRALPAIAPTYFSNGNHETRTRYYTGEHDGKYRYFVSELRKAGVHVLNNRSETVDIAGCHMRIFGLEVPLPYYRKFHLPSLRLRKMWWLCGSPDEEAFNILLAHNPQFARTYMNWGADLCVCGHFHGGLVRGPLLGRALLNPYGFVFPRYGYGHFMADGRHLVVSSGLGDHNIPIRVFNPHEMVVIDLVPEDEDAAER